MSYSRKNTTSFWKRFSKEINNPDGFNILPYYYLGIFTNADCDPAKMAKWLAASKGVWVQTNYSPGLGTELFSGTLFQRTFCSMF